MAKVKRAGSSMKADALIDLCRSRGLTMGRHNPTDELLQDPDLAGAALLEYMELLDSYAGRLLLREAIKTRDPAGWTKGRRAIERFCAPPALDLLLDRFEGLGIIRMRPEGYPETCRRVRSFGSTYEWYVSAILKRRFGCPSAWGVTFTGEESGGDHDVIASVSGDLLYMEVKTAPPRHVELPEVNAFVSRLNDISPDLAILHEDTHLRMKDKIVPLLEEAIAGRCPKPDGPRFERLEREVFSLDGAVYVINSKPDLTRNLQVVFRHYFRCRSRVIRSLF